MKLNEKIIELAKECRNSSFNRGHYCVNLDFKRFLSGILLHTWYEEFEKERNENKFCISSSEWLNHVTPGFQRANTKWNKNMKTKFIENLLKGAKVELMFFRMGEFDDGQIIDGLQRTTAIIDFLDGKIKPFGHSDLKEHLGMFSHHNLTIKIYTFNTWEEVGRFYIDMNENITHSKKDIQKAKDWFLEKHNIQL